MQKVDLERRESRFAITDKHGEQVWVSREEFMVIYRKLIKEWTKKSAKK